MVMFLNEDGTVLSSDNSHSFVSPRHILRSHRRGAINTGSSPSFDRARAGYEQMAKSQERTNLRPNKLDSGDETRRRRLREVETERRRNGYPPLPPSSPGDDSQAPPMAREPVPVQIMPANDDGSSSSRLSSLLYEGIESSRRLVRASSPHENDVVWLVDLSRIMCSELVDEADLNMRKRIERHRQAASEGKLSPFGQPPLAAAGSPARLTSALLWKIIIIDFSDFGYVAEDDVYYGIDDFALDCIKPLSDLIGRRNVYFASREHVLGRNIQPISGEDEEQPFGPLGERIDYQRMHLIHFMMGKVRRIDFSHRTLLEKCLKEEVSTKMEGGVANNPLDMASMDRPYDVAHFWKVGSDDNHTSVIRDAVNDVVRSLGANDAPDKKASTMKAFADPFGEDLGSFKSINVTCPLAREMLQYKILVVAQKDNYEGHYRLMDALLSGALVMTDPMSRLPLFLEDRVNVVVYRSPAELRRLLKLYLLRDHEAERIEIGRKGREIALRHHSPAAWVERMVFGNWSTLMG